MTTLRRILIAATGVIAAAGLASADSIIGYNQTLSFTTTDLLNNTSIVLPAWNPGDSNFMSSNVSGGSYSTGISMASLNQPNVTYILEGFNISVKETLTGNYSITNTSTNSAATGTAHIDTYTAVALNGTLSPPLSNNTDPTNDLFNCSVTGVGTPNPPCAQGQQITSGGGGPDPNSPESNGFTIAANGGTFSSGTINVNSGWVDYGCEVTNKVFCSEVPISGAANSLLFSGLGKVTGPPDLTFDLSTVTQTVTAVTGGNLSTTYNTQVQEQIEVTYDYVTSSSTPEPATMALLGGALLGLGLIGKRFTKR